MLELLDKAETDAINLLHYRTNSARYDQGWVGYRIIFGDLVTERVQTKFNGLTYELDRNIPVQLNVRNRHYHTGPLAIKIVEGVYFMERGEGELTSPPISQGIIPIGSSYQMLRRNEWHNIAPETEVYTLGIMGEPFSVSPDIPRGLSVERLDPRVIDSIKLVFKKKLRLNI